MPLRLPNAGLSVRQDAVTVVQSGYRKESNGVDHPPDRDPGHEAASSLQELAKKHLWMHFTRMGAYGDDSRSRSS